MSDPITVRVLLVEDDEDDYLITRDLLAEVGPGRFALDWVRTCDEARLALCGPHYDICLLDNRLVGCSGLELLREMGPDRISVPVILLTGLDDETLDEDALQSGAADYISKQRLDGRTLARAMRYALERYRSRQALRQHQIELELRVAARTAELSAVNDALSEAHRLKDEFQAMLAHELRGPLAPIRNALMVLRRQHADDVARTWAIDVLDRQTTHLARLVDDLLDATRLSRGKIRLDRSVLDLSQLVRTTASDHRIAVEGAELTLTVETPPDAVWVEGDRTRLAQVIGNLLTNATKFTDPHGTVTVRLTQQNGHATVAVRDTGVGLDADTLARVFTPFAQADRSLDRSKGGLGLGLALVQGLVEMHGGRVWAESEGPGRGALFALKLPVVAAPAELPSHDAPAELSGGSRKILIIEDGRDTAESLRRLLELFGHQVIGMAHTGPDGVAAAERLQPDVILCDIGLPGWSGFEVAQRLRASPLTRSAKLLAVSGYGRDDDRDEARDAGFDAHLTKPVDPEELAKLLID